MRLFIAVNLPAAERHAIHAATTPVRDVARGVSWVAEANVHLTLKFLGEQTASALDGLRGAVREVGAAHRPFALTLGGLGAFPNLREPRIVWMGVHQSPALERVYRDVESACAALGISADARPFRPHLTLGRVRAPLERAAAQQLAERARAVQYSGTVEVRAVDLMSSTLTPGGSKYEVVESANLGRA